MSQKESRSKPTSNEKEFQRRIVRLISVDRNPEKAVEELAQHYGVETPLIRMGLPKGERKALGCYVHREETIYFADQESLYDPYVVIHEFYHHLRNASGKHRGTERHARNFAVSFLREGE